MRPLLFGADFHLGACQYGLAVREDDYQHAFDTFYDVGISMVDTDLVLLGDVGNISFERRAILRKIREATARAAAAGRTTYYIGGNHDNDVVSLPTALGMPNFVDAEQAFYAALAAGTPFLPYGKDGPKVAALHATSHEELWRKLRAIRDREQPENASTEIWLHQAIAPGARTMFAEFDAVDFINSGWHTIMAGDIHNGGIFHVSAANNASGLLIYPGSPEMTDIDELPRRRGFIVHRPTSSEPAATSAAFAQIAYQHRPYRTFDFPADRTPEQLEEVIEWARKVFADTGLKPVVRIYSVNGTWRNDPAILPHCIKLISARPKTVKPEMVATAPAELLPSGEIGGGNAARYGFALGPGTVFQKLERVMGLSELPPEVKELGAVVLTYHGNPEKWVEFAGKQVTRPPDAECPDDTAAA